MNAIYSKLSSKIHTLGEFQCYLDKTLGLTLRHFYVQRPEEFTAWVFPAITAEAPAIDALYARGSVTFEGRWRLADLALQHRR
jgi:hypothetical protein